MENKINQSDVDTLRGMWGISFPKSGFLIQNNSIPLYKRWKTSIKWGLHSVFNARYYKSFKIKLPAPSLLGTDTKM